MHLAQGLCDCDELLHRVIGRLDDPRREEQPLDVVAFVEVQSERDHLFRREPGATDVRGDAIDAEDAVIGAEVGQQDFEQRNAASIRCVGVADSRAVGVADAFTSAGPLGPR